MGTLVDSCLSLVRGHSLFSFPSVLLCERVWLTFTRGDQLAQIAAYERAPRIRAATEAFELGSETDVCKTDFRFALLLSDLKNDIRTIPLAFVFHKAELAV